MSRMQGKDSTDGTTAYAGIDVCKAWLDVHVAAGRSEEAFRAANTAAGIAGVVARLEALGVARVALEATGRMHIAAWSALAEAGIAVVVLNPYRARRFAEALGQLAKTDRSTPGSWRSPPGGSSRLRPRRPRRSSAGSGSCGRSGAI